LEEKVKNITLLVGTRPNIVKAAAFLHAIEQHHLNPQQKVRFNYRLLHSGQHYAPELSDLIFRDLNLPYPHRHLGVDAGSSGVQTAHIILQLEEELAQFPPDIFVVFGDVTSTFAGAIAASKWGVPIAHVESGLRCGDKNMPEEINRIGTDALSTLHYVSLPSGIEHLQREGKEGPRVFFSGNLMIDTLLLFLPKAAKPILADKHKLNPQSFILLTIHRAQNLKSKEEVELIVRKVLKGAKDQLVIFPLHPRTWELIHREKLNAPNLQLIPALPYLSFLYLMKNASLIVTDSGGISEESSFLNIPCITLRRETERPETVELGTNELCSPPFEDLPSLMERALSGRWKKAQVIPGSDGLAGQRLIRHLAKFLTE